MTTLAHEREKRRLWKLKPACASMRVFDALVENEFQPPEAQHAWRCQAVTTMVRFAAVHTPFYVNLFAKLGLDPQQINGPEDLTKLPVLGKKDVIDFQQELRSRRLPAGERIFGAAKSSGTTGQPVMVVHTHHSNTMFAYLAHRSIRWFGIHPMHARLMISPAHYLGPQPGKSSNPDGNIVRRPNWLYLGQFFETGPEYAFNVSNPMEQQVAWLRELRPDFAVTDPGVFEELLLASGGEKPVDSLKALIGSGSMLPASLRTLLEERYAIPIQQVYGLNEIGSVAVRCEAGRYHVHAEHCLVEITDADGRPTPPGEIGHVLVTGLRNFAMPLIRYNTGDMAEAVDGPCSCGRTLPSFGPIAGRYRRYAGLPHGTRERFQAIRGAVEKHSPAELDFLRRYQIHQDRQNRFTLRLRTVGPIPEQFRQNVLRAWEPVAGTPPSFLTIVEVEDIAPSPGGKLLDFVSDFYTDPAAAPSEREQAGQPHP